MTYLLYNGSRFLWQLGVVISSLLHTEVSVLYDMATGNAGFHARHFYCRACTDWQKLEKLKKLFIQDIKNFKTFSSGPHLYFLQLLLQVPHIFITFITFELSTCHISWCTVIITILTTIFTAILITIFSTSSPTFSLKYFHLFILWLLSFSACYWSQKS